MSFWAVPRVRAHGIGYPIEQTELAAPVYTKPRPDITEITPDTSPKTFGDWGELKNGRRMVPGLLAGLTRGSSLCSLFLPGLIAY